MVDVLQRILAEQDQVGVAARLDGADLASRLAADGPGGIARSGQERRGRGQGDGVHQQPELAEERRPLAARDRRRRGRCRR